MAFFRILGSTGLAMLVFLASGPAQQICNVALRDTSPTRQRGIGSDSPSLARRASVPRALVLEESLLCSSGTQASEQPVSPVAKIVLGSKEAGESLLRPEDWQRYEKGFDRQGDWFVCDNGAEGRSRRGASQTVRLNQVRPEPVVASCWSRAEGVSGGTDSDYALYLDLVYTDGTTLWGQTASFSTGTHDWQHRQVVVLPQKPIKTLSFHMLLRGHAGKAWFRDAELRIVRPPAGACLFDGLPVAPRGRAREGFQIRDVAAGSDFVYFTDPKSPEPVLGNPLEALGVELAELSTVTTSQKYQTIETPVTVTDLLGKDRAITLVYVVPVEDASLRWLDDVRRSTPIEPGREYLNASRFHAGSLGQVSRYPLGAVAGDHEGTALAVDPAWPAFCRIGYSAGTKELYLAYDLALTAEKPKAELRFRRFKFDAGLGFRGALARYYELYPEAFRCRTPQQGLWMPFAKISQVQGWQDFGFKFKEGNDETEWDDRHGILTFRYTEPMTWWMAMPKDMPRTLDAALAEAKRLAGKGNAEAQALLTSGYHDCQGRFAARLLDTPWCNGAVWSMNSMPGISGPVTDFKNKWSAKIRERLYGPQRRGDLDGEYVDSSEGYVTDELDFRREHFAAARTPLTFSQEEHQPAIFRGLIAFEYVRGIETDIHRQNKLMMANGAPDRLWWLAPMLDVLGTETDWHSGGRWRPMSDAELLYRRAMCKGKPFCFLMNTRFEDFSHELVEKYMKRCLAYGMFPGFFSANASGGHYFTRPELYDRDRPLFKRYVPLCRRLAEAGWEPITRARTDDDHVYVERFGDRCWTVFNDSDRARTVTIALESGKSEPGRELLSGRIVPWREGRTRLSLEAEDVAVIEIP
ncbi:MAG: hypothetical protein ABSG68_06250 [Thermoguttaceae bacterium]|jgi:hypothetical protein